MTKRIAFLGCEYCLPDSTARRDDAYEHDREFSAFRPAFKSRGMSLVEVDWETLDPIQSNFDFFMVRTTWNYVEKPSLFIQKLNEFSSTAPVQNSPQLIKWNMSKYYLDELTRKGLPVIPSFFINDRNTSLDDIRLALNSDQIVLKPTFGGGGFGQRKTTDFDDGSEIIAKSLFAQPFVHEITTAGELSYIFIGEEFSHCIRKLPAKGEYLIHSYHGGSEHLYEPTNEEIAIARGFLKSLPQKALTTRVDIVPTQNGPLLMELEAIEPHLFPQFSNRIADLLADAVFKQLYL